MHQEDIDVSTPQPSLQTYLLDSSSFFDLPSKVTIAGAATD
jgi:hypothetical protein